MTYAGRMAQRYRAQADEFRTIADTDPETIAAFARLARDFDRIAGDLEAVERGAQQRG